MDFLKQIYLFIIIALISSCSMNKPILEAKISSQSLGLNLDGFYYLKDTHGKGSFFLYQNGIYLFTGSSEKYSGSLEEHKLYLKKITDKNNEHNSYKYKQDWGVYEVGNKRIKISSYFPIGYGGYSIRTFDGTISNQNEIIIHSINNEKLKEPIVYIFQPYYPKPDSTNNFIK